MSALGEHTERPLALGVAEVAHLLSCSERHVYRLIEEGDLPIVPHMRGRKVVPTEAVERLVRQAMTQQLVRCTPCWMGPHRQCERGACTCTDPIHDEDENGDSPVREHRAVEERGRLTAAEQAG